MSRWYWGAVVCAVLFGITCLMPAYVNEEGGAVWPWQIGRGWNNRDADGRPTHDDLGNRIKPNWVRTAALVVFGAGAGGLAVAGYFYPTRRRPAAQPHT
ncbi:MAG TPA: hypothetical protein VKA46_05995 [Gemmataceae bacterium]|nr:hypothetical protein [Gemmataceae bacterium]